MVAVRKFMTCVLGIFFLALAFNAQGLAAPQVLRITHQWTSGADYRDQLCNNFARKVEEGTKGAFKCELYPSASLFKPVAMYDALLKGALDFALLPLDYASGKIPQVDITHMPCTVRDHREGMAWRDAPIGKAVEKICEENGIKILTYAWNRGGIGSIPRSVIRPADAKGLKFRAGGKSFETMLYKGAGAAITSIPSTEIYMAFQSGVLDAALTSTQSFVSFRLYEVMKYYTSVREYSIFNMSTPLLVSMATFKRLSPEQQKVIVEAGRDMDKFAKEEGEKADEAQTKELEKAGVKVVNMPKDAYNEWKELAKKTAWREFAERVKGGQELLDLAFAVK